MLCASFRAGTIIETESSSSNACETLMRRKMRLSASARAATTTQAAAAATSRAKNEAGPIALPRLRAAARWLACGLESFVRIVRILVFLFRIRLFEIFAFVVATYRD